MFLFGPPNVKKMKARRDVQGLIKALRYEDENIRETAIKALSEIGSPAVESLIAALRGGTPLARAGAVLALGEISDARTVDSLINVVKNEYEEESVRRRAIEALRKNSDSRTIDVLIEMLDDSRVRDAAVTTLIELGDKCAVTRITKVIKKEERISVVAHAKVLAAFRDERAIRPLIQVLTSEFKRIDAESHRAIADALSAIGAPAVEPLIALLDTFKPEHRETAIVALGDIYDQRVAEALIERWAEEASPYLKMKIAEALGNYDDPRIVDYLVEELQKWLGVRKAAWERKIVAQTLVKIYRRAQIPDAIRSKILSNRSVIVKQHSDAHQDKSYSDFSHLDKHSDNGGIGVDFPL